MQFTADFPKKINFKASGELEDWNLQKKWRPCVALRFCFLASCDALAN